jgi:hypothetical protein
MNKTTFIIKLNYTKKKCKEIKWYENEKEKKKINKLIK